MTSSFKLCGSFCVGSRNWKMKIYANQLFPKLRKEITRMNSSFYIACMKLMTPTYAWLQLSTSITLYTSLIILLLLLTVSACHTPLLRLGGCGTWTCEGAAWKARDWIFSDGILQMTTSQEEGLQWRLQPLSKQQLGLYGWCFWWPVFIICILSTAASWVTSSTLILIHLEYRFW